MVQKFFFAQIETPLGRMLASADKAKLYGLIFCRATPCDAQTSPPLEQIREEIAAYFKGSLHSFKTPVGFLGTPFQLQVWQALLGLPFGSQRCYSDIAAAIGKPGAVRAVGRALASNPLHLIVPCHRVICHSGKLGGFAGGVERKAWLLRHEHA